MGASFKFFKEDIIVELILVWIQLFGLNLDCLNPIVQTVALLGSNCMRVNDLFLSTEIFWDWTKITTTFHPSNVALKPF